MLLESKNNERTVYNVMRDETPKRWVVWQEKRDFRREFDIREDAVNLAKLKANLDSASLIKVYRKDGTLDYERSFGGGPEDTAT